MAVASPTAQPSVASDPSLPKVFKLSKSDTLKQRFFWGSYGAFLAASVPHMVYFFMSFSDGSVFELLVSIVASLAIESAIYVCTYAFYAYLYGKMDWAKFLKMSFLLLAILVCFSISFITNVVHSVHFENVQMLTKTDTIPGHEYFAYIAGGWPLLGILFSLVSKVVVKELPVEIEEDHTGQVEQTPEQIERETQLQLALLRSQNAIAEEKTRLQGRLRKNQIAEAGGSVLEGIGQMFSRGQASSSVPDDEQTAEEQTHQAPTPGSVLPPQMPVPELPRPHLATIEEDHVEHVEPVKEMEGHHVLLLNTSQETINFVGLRPQISPAPEQRKDTSLDMKRQFQPTLTPVMPMSEPFTTPEEPQVFEPPITDYTSAMWTEVKIVSSEDVGYSARKTGFIRGSLPYESFGNAFKTEELAHPKITKGALAYLMDNRLLDPRFFLYVRIGKQTHRVIINHKQIRAKILDALAAAEASNAKIPY